MPNIQFSVISLIFTIMLAVCYFSKKRISTIENEVFTIMLILCIIIIGFDISSVFAILGKGKHYLLTLFFAKGYLITLLTWANFFVMYIFSLCYKKSTKEKIEIKNLFEPFYIISFIAYLIALTAIVILPITYNIDGNNVYTSGPSVDVDYIVLVISTIEMVTLILFKYKNMKNKNLIPVTLFVFFGCIVGLVQLYYPEVLLMSSLATVVMYLMFFTIENPDIKIMNELNMAKEEAEKANRAKTDFLSSMSHEIRTPLNAIVGFSNFIKTSETLEEAKENAADVITSSETLLEIVNGILDISKIESGKLEIIDSSYETKPFFESIRKLAIARLGSKDLKFNVNIAEDIPAVLYGDHSNLKKIIVNLLTNAIKYTDEGSFSFDVSCVKQKNICRLIIAVEDTGRGIKEDSINKLFTKFQRLEEDRNTTIEGTGLGLAITKQLVELMGGNIVVQSIYGKGSKFTVAVNQKIDNNYVPEKKTSEDTVYKFPGKKICIVDDNNLNLKVAKKLLSSYELDITLLDSGDALLDSIINNDKYDLILLDDMMPHKNGEETFKDLKTIDGFKTPVVMLTANAISGMKEKYMDEGFNDYLSKPIEVDELQRVLAKFLTLKKSRVLIVDDNKININVASKFLKSYDINVISAESGDEAIKIIKEDKDFDIIFMDDMMPKMDGVETFHELENLDGFNIPVVALTANAIEGAREHYLDEGMDEYISKPIDKKELERVLKLFLNI